jgi:hypothetical protein
VLTLPRFSVSTVMRAPQSPDGEPRVPGSQVGNPTLLDSRRVHCDIPLTGYPEREASGGSKMEIFAEARKTLP